MLVQKMRLVEPEQDLLAQRALKPVVSQGPTRLAGLQNLAHRCYWLCQPAPKNHRHNQHS
jgi:hypothetical protein